MGSLKFFSEKLMSWNMYTFGCIFQRKRRLEGVMKALDV